MGKIYTGVSNLAKQVSKIYAGVGGVAKQISKVYAGDEDGVARLVYSKEPLYLIKDGALQDTYTSVKYSGNTFSVSEYTEYIQLYAALSYSYFKFDTQIDLTKYKTATMELSYVTGTQGGIIQFKYFPNGGSDINNGSTIATILNHIYDSTTKNKYTFTTNINKSSGYLGFFLDTVNTSGTTSKYKITMKIYNLWLE